MQPWLDKTLKYGPHGRPVTDNPKDKLYVVSTDTDGVLANWVDAFLEVFNQRCGKTITQDQWTNDRPWLAEPEPLMTKAQFEETFDATLHIPEFWLHLKPYDNIDFAAINNDLGDALYNLYVLTGRVNLLADEGITDTTQMLSRWVRAAGVPLVTGCNAGADDREDLLANLDVDFHLDDFIDHVEEINKGKHTRAYLMDRPWNRQYDVGDLRCTSFDDFLMKTIFADREFEGKSK
jgi:hypothetical protein